MDNSNVLVRENHQVNEEKPPPRVCPRCSSDNTKFCFYNNYRAVRLVAAAAASASAKRTTSVLIDLPPPLTLPLTPKPAATKQTGLIACLNLATTAGVVADSGLMVNNHQPCSHAQETNEFLGTFGGSSSSVAAVGNHFSYSTETHSVMVPPIRSIPPMAHFDGSFNQGYHGAGFNDLVGNPLMNQSFGGHVGNYNSYFVNQEDPNMRNQSFNSSMNMNHSASTSGSREYPGIDNMINNNNNKYVFRSSYHLEKHGP
ncbi:hypothetical protein F2Q68_00014322 [Brassica cretica]|uniref:Dof-type domain-containing protein n=1 Tax=Brassica cretica TaxID=69181 RepID=A0A8S9HA69_BRACR|nr:hypothetical protein F2Q68_00014322 [Brassica cretica]